ncbi:MAG: [FeFe] hydrogenase H-cluster radical SAM maturase HydE [Vampirovibrionales bacterium]|nr:[FeFe] hydrogenase H-cluster radical SAM maturase HydE [Vampirovibrionales bacterium]
MTSIAIDASKSRVAARLYEERAALDDDACRALLLTCLRWDDPADVARLLGVADEVRRQHKGDGILLRGIVEFSNQCQNACHYCGLFRENADLPRYHLDDEAIFHAVEMIAGFGIQTVVLQSGETDDDRPERVAGWIRRIKAQFPSMAVTLSLGEKSAGTLALWRAAGADRYLLKIETTDPELYAAMHPGMSLSQRMACHQTLLSQGYQTGSGGIVGLPGQSCESLAGDLLYHRRWQFQMTSVSPLIPHPATPLADLAPGDLDLTLKVIALMRLLVPDANSPATTAMGSMQGVDNRPRALQAGANVIMLNFTPPAYKKQYEIYPGKRCLNEAFCAVACIEKMAAGIGRHVDFAAGHARVGLPAS